MTLDEHSETVKLVKAEFLEMPGMRLTVAQAARLWHLDAEESELVLQTLVDTQFLIQTRNAYIRR
jgi:hypothetical protein